jgi:serine/threonine protein kinase
MGFPSKLKALLVFVVLPLSIVPSLIARNIPLDNSRCQLPQSDTATTTSREPLDAKLSSSNHDPQQQKLPNGFLELLREDTRSWLENLEFGPGLGYGAVSTTVRATFKDQVPTNQYNGTEYIVKMAAGDNERSLATVGVEAVCRVYPHPSIPRTLHFAPAVDSNALFGQPTRDEDHEHYYHKKFWANIKDEDKAEIFKKEEVSIIVEERKFPTQRHATHYDDNGEKNLIVPAPLVKCFFRLLFEVLDYAHKRNVMLRDIGLNNMMISHGELILFDWNLAKVYNPNRLEEVFTFRLRKIGPPENVHKEHHSVYVNAHAWDVWVLGQKIIGKYLAYQASLEEGEGDKYATDLLLSRTELDLLEDLKSQMMVLDPAKRPTLRKLLDKHAYFADAPDNCTLAW